MVARSSAKTSVRSKRLSQGWERVPAGVRRAHGKDWSVIPQTGDKRSYVKWAKYQHELPLRKDVIEWNRRWPHARWAIVTGRRSILVLDFDGDEGVATTERLGVDPTIETPSGGAHIWVTGVDWPVIGGARVDPGHFPNMDIRADGQVATFLGTGYKMVGQAIDFADLPQAVQSLLRRRKKTKRTLMVPELPEGFDDLMATQVILGEALARLDTNTRNETGFWLACQLRDERYSRLEVEHSLNLFAEIVSNSSDHPYTREEAYGSIVSAFNQPARLPRALKDADTTGFLSEIAEEKLAWFWNGRIPERKVTILEGDPDRGKTLITADLIARTTRGRAMPGNHNKRDRGGVILLTAEDDLADTVKPRLQAVGADVNLVAFIKLEKDEKGNIIPLNIPEDLSKIHRAIREVETRSGVPVRLVVIDRAVRASFRAPRGLCSRGQA